MTSPHALVYRSMLRNDLDLLGDRVIHTEGHERLEYWKAFENMYKLFPHNNVTFGRIFNRHWMCQVVVTMTIANLLAEGQEIGDGFDEFPNYPLTDWVEADWNGLQGWVSDGLTNLLRTDADASTESNEDARTHGQRGRSKIYKSKRDRILRFIRLHKALSPVRKTLTEQLDDEALSNDEHPTLDPGLMKTFWSAIQKEEDQFVKDALLGLFDNDDRSSNNNTHQLLRLGDLRQILKAKPFSFLLFNQKVNNSMCAWAQDAFEDPLLNDIYFPDDSEDGAAVQQLRHARVALNQEGEDPLHESIRLASTIGRPPSVPEQQSTRHSSQQKKRPRGGNLLRKKKTATRLDFEDAVEDELSEPDEDVVLSELPSRAIRVNSNPSPSPAAKRRRSQEKKYEGRRIFTNVEKQAIKEGIRELGAGNWAQIKELYKVILENRTSQQIKDCYRTMKKRNELDDIAVV